MKKVINWNLVLFHFLFEHVSIDEKSTQQSCHDYNSSWSGVAVGLQLGDNFGEGVGASSEDFVDGGSGALLGGKGASVGAL